MPTMTATKMMMALLLLLLLLCAALSRTALPPLVAVFDLVPPPPALSLGGMDAPHTSQYWSGFKLILLVGWIVMVTATTATVAVA
jgi:hypothetical protein